MRYEIGFGVEYDRYGNPIRESAAIVADIVEQASRKFGGCSLIHVDGGWVDPAGDLVTEKGAILRIDIATVLGNDPAIPYDEDSIKAFARFIRDRLNQASVLVSCYQTESWSVDA